MNKFAHKFALGASVIAAFLSAQGANAAAKSAAPAACAIDHAVYTQKGNPGVSMGFAKQGIKTSYASDLVLYVQRGKDKFWFGFEAPNGYGGTYLYPRLDPKLVKPAADGETPSDTLPPGDPSAAAIEAAKDETIAELNFDAFNAALDAFTGPPQLSSKAPAYIFARDLGPLFHYAHNGNLYKLSEPVGIEIAMWRQTGCLPK
jgi:hypothetical protein